MKWEIPEDIKKRIQDATLLYAHNEKAPMQVTIPAYNDGCYFGYQLAAQQIDTANEFIRDIAKLLGEDDLGLDGKTWGVDDFKDAIEKAESQEEWISVEELKNIISSYFDVKPTDHFGLDAQDLSEHLLAAIGLIKHISAPGKVDGWKHIGSSGTGKVDEKGNDYWKKRCEAAEKIVDISGVVNCEGFDAWQQLKQQSIK